MNRSPNVSLAVALGGSLVALALVAVGRRVEMPAVVDLAVAALAMVVALVALQSCLVWWRTADEAVREAHKFAWYWGGSVGLGAAAGLATVLTGLPKESLERLALPGDARLFAFGVAACAGCQAVGYGVAWAGWWWKRR